MRVVGIALLLATPACGQQAGLCADASDAMLSARVEAQVRTDTPPNLFEYQVTRSADEIVVKGRYKRPTPGFDPVARFRPPNCEMSEIEWM